jgi:hypothetical protein
MVENLTRAEYEFLLRHDFATFAGRCFQDLNPQTDLAMNWHLEVIAAKLTEVREGKIRRLIINLPPRHLKSLMASIAFPAWHLGLDPTAQMLCVSYAQGARVPSACRRGCNVRTVLIPVFWPQAVTVDGRSPVRL